MAKSVCSNASPIMLKWARETAGLSVDEVAEAEKLPWSQLGEWEQGISLPTYAQLERLAKRYKRPMMVFFLDSPPKGFTVVKDYRSARDLELSPESRLALRRVQEMQAWAASYLDDQGVDPARIVGLSELSDDPSKAGAHLRKLLEVEIKDQVSCGSANAAYRMWRAKCESLGILVFTFSGVDVGEMRGFAISNTLAPAVAVNNKDDYPARTFSLLHECVHILLNDSGISTRSREALNEFNIERFCESAAAEALMPMEDFKRFIPRTIANLEQVIGDVSQRYWCSRKAALYRLVDSGHLSLTVAHRIARSIVTTDTAKEPVKIPPATLAIGRNGSYFSKIAIGAYYNGDIHGGELANLLNMSLKHLPKLESKVYRSQVHFGTASK